MKYKSFIILLILFTCIYSKAQNKGFTAGASLGFYGIHINGEINKFYSPTHGIYWGTGGLSFGLNVKRNIAKKTYASLELRYSRKGSLYEFITNKATKGFESIRLDYIELPVLVGYKMNLNQKHLFLETGIAFSRLTYSRMEVNNYNWWDTKEKLSYVYKNDVLWIAHIKYPIIKSKKLLLGFRFAHSLKSIHENYKLYHMNYGIEVCYLFK